MSYGITEIDRILELLENHIDLEHCLEVDELYMAALRYDAVDRPPLVIQVGFGEVLALPPPWNEFKHFDYSETFDNPAAMLQNMLLDRVVPGVLLKDDNPLAIRNNHGTIQVASVLGGNWGKYENNYPWVNHFNDIEDIKKIVREKIDDQDTIRFKGILPHSLETLRFYSSILSKYEKCRKAIQISLPDLQGPLDTAEQLWGSDIYLSFYENPELLCSVLSAVTDAMAAAEKVLRRFTYDRLDPENNTQHGYVIPGRILIRDDSAIVISPEMYAETIRPYDAKILELTGGGSIHFCGRGDHLVEKMMEIPNLKGLDLGQPEYMDVKRIYDICRERYIVLTNLNPQREDIVNGKAAKEFPTGVVFVYHTNSFEDAANVVSEYKSR